MPPRKYETYLIYGPSLDGGLPFGPGSNKYSRVCRNSTNRIRYSSAIEIEANELRKLDETSKELKKEEERFIFHIRELNQYLSRADCKVGLQGFTDVDHIIPARLFTACDIFAKVVARRSWTPTTAYVEDIEGQVNVIKGMTVHVREILKIVIPWNATFRLLLTKLESPDMDQESQEAETIARDMHQQLTLFYESYVLGGATSEGDTPVDAQ